MGDQMMERPDLDAIEGTARHQKGPFWGAVRDLLTYCRELEAENRRLRAVAEQLVEREKACGSMAVDDDTLLQMAREVVEAQEA